jgi:hypothetical protein
MVTQRFAAIQGETATTPGEFFGGKPGQKRRSVAQSKLLNNDMSKSWRAIVLILATTSSGAFGAPAASATSSDRPNVAQTNAIERITPDGQSTPVALKSQTDRNILTLDNDTISCPLREGDTTFIISLARSSTLDRFTFINENTAARGELRIAVSNEKLSADSDKWMPVDGAVSFKRKRLFNLSMLGVDAKYVRLTFHVEHETDMAALGWQSTRTINR